jgi:hypothetical protein
MITKSIILLKVETMILRDSRSRLEPMEAISPHILSRLLLMEGISSSCRKGICWIRAARTGKSLIKLEKVGIKETYTIVPSPSNMRRKRNNASPAASPRGIFLAKRLTGDTNSRCISRDMKKIKAKDGKNQKPEVIVIYTTARTIDV